MASNVTNASLSRTEIVTKNFGWLCKKSEKGWSCTNAKELYGTLSNVVASDESFKLLEIYEKEIKSLFNEKKEKYYTFTDDQMTKIIAVIANSALKLRPVFAQQ